MIDEVSSVIFSGIYNRQGNADEKIAGGAYAFNTLIPETRLYAGLWHRLKESYMPYIGISTSKIMAGLNYSLPSKSVLSYRPRAFEFSLIFTLKSERSVGNTCPF
jgi:hypothetical protein